MKQYQRFILALIVIGTLLSSFHYHADGHVSEDCQICILEHNLSGADFSSLPKLEKITQYEDVPLYSSLSLTSKIPKDFHSRGPPSFS